MKRFFVLFLAVAAFGQSPSVPTPTSETPVAGGAPMQRVGPDDLLSVFVADSPELTKNFRVLGDGTLAVPLLKERIQANGKYPHEIEAEIAGALVREQLLVQPTVSVSVSEYRSIPVSVLGAVRRPITFQAAGEVTLLDALTRADGLSSEAGAEILVSRTREQANADGTNLIQRIPVKGLIDDADPALNIRLHGGEEIRVPAAGRVYVIGNVKKTGAFPIQDGKDTTVLKMIALTEGVLPYTNKEAYIYRREGGKNSRNEIVVPLQQIMKHKAADVELQANDILYVPDSSGRRASAETIKLLTGFGVSTASGLLIWR